MDSPHRRGPVVQGFLGIAEHFGEEEVVVLEAILVHELGLLDANVLFPRIRLVRSSLFAAVLFGARGVGGYFQGLGNLLSLSYSSSGDL